MLKIRRSRDRHIFNMRIPYLAKTVSILKRSPVSYMRERNRLLHNKMGRAFILCMRSAPRRRYTETPSLIGWAHTQERSLSIWPFHNGPTHWNGNDVILTHCSSLVAPELVKMTMLYCGLSNCTSWAPNHGGSPLHWAAIPLPWGINYCKQ